MVIQKPRGHGNRWTDDDLRELRAHSESRTPISVVAKKLKRTEGSLRRKAAALGIGLGQRRP